MKFLRATALALAAAAVLAPAALATPAVTPYNRYTINDASTLAGLKVEFRNYLLFPKKLTDKTANGGPVLRFGPIGSCRFNLSVSANVTSRDVAETAVAHAARLQPADAPYVYAEGTRKTAAWRVVRLKGTANVRSIWVLPVSLRTTALYGGATVPAWLELRGTANEHTDGACHSGGPRYIGDILGEAFGATSGTAFSTDLPRVPGPPNPAA